MTSFYTQKHLDTPNFETSSFPQFWFLFILEYVHPLFRQNNNIINLILGFLFLL